METGRSSSVYSAYSSVRSMPRTNPSDDTISVTTRPHPPWRLTSRRKAESVMPAIGATTNGEARVRTLASQTADDTLERTVHDLHHHPFADHRARIVGELAFNQRADPLDLVLGNRRGLSFERDDVDYTGALQDGKPLARVEAREAVAGKQRPVDLLLAVLPAAPARDGGKEGLDPLLFELLADDLLVTRPGPERIPTHFGIRGRCDLGYRFSGVRFQARFRHQ